MTAATAIVMAIIVFMGGLIAGTQFGNERHAAEIAGTPAIGLHCAEDETIFWVGVDTLGCVHAGLVHDH